MTRRRVASAEELRLWRQVVRDVEPLPGRTQTVEPETPAPAPADGPAASQPLPRMPAPGPRPARLPDLDLTTSPGLDKRTDDRLRRGQLAIDGRLDLHGRTQAEAHAVLHGFVTRAWHEQRRCLLVITGKGSSGGGVLRQAVPRWFNEPPLRSFILAVRPAQQRHGGDGALYVLLKRRRHGP